MIFNTLFGVRPPLYVYVVQKKLQIITYSLARSTETSRKTIHIDSFQDLLKHCQERDWYELALFYRGIEKVQAVNRIKRR